MYKIPKALIGESRATLNIAEENVSTTEFIGQTDLLLETADCRIFAYPYYLEDRIGRIFKIIPGGAGGSGSENSERTLRYIERISPKLPERIRYQPITVVEQVRNSTGNLVLTAVMNDEQIEIELCDES